MPHAARIRTHHLEVVRLTGDVEAHAPVLLRLNALAGGIVELYAHLDGGNRRAEDDRKLVTEIVEGGIRLGGNASDLHEDGGAVVVARRRRRAPLRLRRGRERLREWHEISLEPGRKCRSDAT